MSDRNSGWAYQPALDGLRAIAVIAVVLYHLGYGWARGGFLGVDTFFVLSGYLITSLLLLEWQGERTLALLAFWGRRMRRLLPAVLLLLGATAMAAATFVPKLELGRLRGDALSGLFDVANWRFITSGQSYFDLFSAPSPLRHLWSLAIEEQFYVAWPVIVMLTLRFARGAHRALGGVCVVGIVASVTAMGMLYQAGDPSRAYYGTDARVHTILVGALLAIALHRRPLPQRVRRLSSVIGSLALVGAIGCFAAVSERAWFLYHGGSLLFACLVVPVIVMSAGSGGGIARVMLSFPALRWIGRISYGIYLWHWPMIVWLTPARLGFDGVMVDVVRVAAALALATASFYLIERPIRHASFAGFPRRAGAAVTAAIVAVALIGATANAQAQPSYYGTGETASSLCVPTKAEAQAVQAEIAATGGKGTQRLVAGHRVLLIGDSTACSLFPALRAVGALHGVRVANGTVVGCGVVGDHYSAFKLRTYHCHDFATQVEQTAFAAARPDIVVWSSSWERTGIEINKQLVDPTSPRWNIEIRRRMADVVHRFAASGAHVVMLTQPPFGAGVDPATGKPTASALFFTRLNALEAQFAREHPNDVTLVDLADLVCPNGGPCRAKVDGGAVRVDGAHFAVHGAVWVARWLLPQVVGTGR